MTALAARLEYGQSPAKEALIPAGSLALIPLDDRPCNRQFPRLLATVAGAEMAIPPGESLGRFLEPGDCDAISAWLPQQRAEHLIVSLEMLSFGGLIASRTPHVSADTALRRLASLREFKRHHPSARALAFSIIMRLGTTVSSTDDLARHQLLRTYSQLVDRVERLGEVDSRQELRAVQERLEDSVLDAYLATRRRNHAVNRAAVELAAEGVIDYLVLGQEDAAPVGMHIPEQLALQSQLAEFRLGDRVALMCGADEMGVLLTARACSEDRSARIAVHYATEAGADIVPAFETESIRAMTEQHVAAAGARRVGPDRAEALLFVHTPIGVQHDLADKDRPTPSPRLAEQAESLAAEIRTALDAGLPVGVADVPYCNGADPELVRALKERRLLGRLAGFAGWNTAANTVGTVIAQLRLASRTRKEKQGHCAQGQEFVAARLADDYGYQTCVRPKALALAEELGANPFSLGADSGRMEEFVRQELGPMAHEFYSEVCQASKPPPVSISLPWGRLFEVEVEFARR